MEFQCSIERGSSHEAMRIDWKFCASGVGGIHFCTLALVLLVSQAAEPVRALDDPTLEPQIIDGNAVEKGKYPFMVALYYRQDGSPSSRTQFCGGTLIDEDSVLSAAHCLQGESPQTVGATVGRTVLDSDQGKVREVTEFFKHPRYDRSETGFAYDSAVLKLDQPVSGIEPIRVASEDQNRFETPGRDLVVTGWGTTAKDPPPEEFPERMRKAMVPVVSDSRTADIYNRNVKRFYPPLMVAAGGEGRDTCIGDSGGPMFDRTDSGAFVQVGITSFGLGCAEEDIPGVYTEVNDPAVRNFIFNAAAK